MAVAGFLGHLMAGEIPCFLQNPVQASVCRFLYRAFGITQVSGGFTDREEKQMTQSGVFCKLQVAHAHFMWSLNQALRRTRARSRSK
jgi:hypothetical protein